MPMEKEIDMYLVVCIKNGGALKNCVSLTARFLAPSAA